MYYIRRTEYPDQVKKDIIQLFETIRKKEPRKPR